jgi:hypothetical protein
VNMWWTELPNIGVNPVNEAKITQPRGDAMNAAIRASTYMSPPL